LKDEFCTPDGSSGAILRGDADMAVFRYDMWTTDDGIFLSPPPDIFQKKSILFWYIRRDS
ncbi:MAG: hypothetical protein ACOCNA_06825, partial [Prevotella pectinovora]